MNKFKVGETYEIIGHAGIISHSFRIGDEVELVRIASNGKDHYYRRKDNLHQFVCDRDVKVKKRCKQNNQKIVITTDGTETLARLYKGGKVIKSATAKCSSEDSFDFNIGANLAFDRLLGKEKKEQKWRVVNRPARKGDYIRLVKEHFSFNEVGDILKVFEVNGLTKVKAVDHPRDTDAEDDYLWNYFDYQFEVVEPAETLELYNGKAICVEGADGMTVGKIYDFSINDGRGMNDFGNPILNHPRSSLEEINSAMAITKFIPLVEYTKGE